MVDFVQELMSLWGLLSQDPNMFDYLKDPERRAEKERRLTEHVELNNIEIDGDFCSGYRAWTSELARVLEDMERPEEAIHVYMLGNYTPEAAVLARRYHLHEVDRDIHRWEIKWRMEYIEEHYPELIRDEERFCQLEGTEADPEKIYIEKTLRDLFDDAGYAGEDEFRIQVAKIGIRNCMEMYKETYDPRILNQILRYVEETGDLTLICPNFMDYAKARVGLIGLPWAIVSQPELPLDQD